MNSKSCLQDDYLEVKTFLMLSRGCRSVVCNFSFVIIFCWLPIFSGNLVSGQTVSPEPDLLDLLEIYSSERAPAPYKPDHTVQVPINYVVQHEELQAGRPVPANFTGGVNTEQIKSDFTGKVPQRSSVELQLWRDRITTLDYEEDTKSKEELRKTIEQLRAVEFKSRDKPAEHVIETEPIFVTEAIEPNEAISENKVLHDPNNKQQESKHKLTIPEGIVTEWTLQNVRNLCKDPSQLENPFELAEVMFHSGHLREASILYRQAVDRKAAKQADVSRDRAWILFQIGNCLRDEDRTEASKMYKQLITEYPDSPWTDLAKAQVKLIDLYQKEKPQALLESSVLQ